MSSCEINCVLILAVFVWLSTEYASLGCASGAGPVVVALMVVVEIPHGGLPGLAFLALPSCLRFHLLMILA